MGLHEILGQDYRVEEPHLIRDPPSRHMPREMIACNKAFPFFGEEQQATGKIAYEEGVKIGSFRGRSIFIAGGGDDFRRDHLIFRRTKGSISRK